MDTASWSVTAIGIYIRLLNYEWVNKCLPVDTKDLARIARVDHGNFLKCWEPLVKGKFQINGVGLVNNRMEFERKKKQVFLDSQRDKGIKSGQVRSNRGSAGVEPGNEPSTNLSFSSSLKDKRLIIPPVLEEVIEYCQNRNNGIDPQVWYDHYATRGWKVVSGKTTVPMKDWQASIRTWEKKRAKEQRGLVY